MNPLLDLAAGIVQGLVTSGAAIIADQQKATAQVLAELRKVADPSLHQESRDAFARRLAALQATPVVDIEDDTDPAGRA